MAFFTQKVWVEWIEQGLANGEYNYYDYKDLNNVEQIGSSKVYKAIMKKDEEEIMVVMKYIGNKLSTREVQSELKLLRKIRFFNNDHISSFYGITKSDSNDKNQLKYMVMLEYGDGGSLREYLQNNSENLHWSVRLKFARQLSKAIEFLHEKNLIHKNLHSNNIIINEQDLKLNALGITCKMEESSNISINLQNYLTYVDPQYFKIPSYKSSEDKQSTLTKKSDIYSLGILLWELASMRLPFSNEEHSDLQKEIMEGLREKDIDGIDQDYIPIYKKCWQSEPDDRPDILEVVSALEKLDDGIDPSMVQENKKVKPPKRRFSIKEPLLPDPPVTKPVKSSTRPQINTTLPPVNTPPPVNTHPPINTTPPTPKLQVNTPPPTPPTPKPQIDTKPPPPKPQVVTTPPQPKSQVVPPPKPQVVPPPKPQVVATPPLPKPQVVPPPKPQVVATPPLPKPQFVPPPKPQVVATPPPPKPQFVPPPKPQVVATPPPPKPQVTPPPKPQINSTPPPSQKPQVNTPPSKIIITKNQSSTLSVPNIKPRSRSPSSPLKRDSPRLRSKSPEDTIIEEDEEEGEKSHRSLSPNKKLSTLKEKSPVRQSRPLGRAVSKSPSRKSLTRAISPNFTTREPRASRRSSSVSLPRNTPKFSRRAQTVAPPQPRLSSPSRCSSPKKPNNRRHSTSVVSVIYSPLQFNAQSSLVGLWSNTSDRREDPTKKIIDELLSLFMETYEVDPGDSLLKSVQEFLENQEEEKSKIFDWLLTTQLSLQYEILLGYFYLNGIGTPIANRKAFVP
ncbi:unnamed protein product [Rhizophagus irregularis]|nr:unnamed protein product [Rhizophagus irregularis]